MSLKNERKDKMNKQELINSTCDACGGQSVRSIRRFGGTRLCNRCYGMLAPTDVHYEHFMW